MCRRVVALHSGAGVNVFFFFLFLAPAPFLTGKGGGNIGFTINF